MKFEKWEVAGYDRALAAAMCREGINPLVALVMASRGTLTAAETRETLRSDMGLLCDPMLLMDMEPAARRVREAIDRGEHVAVYGDYDVDGMTASCLVAGYLRERGLACEIYIPGRIDEGYGVNCAALRELAGKGVTLVITVDCGITAAEEAEYAGSLGMDMVITDHHECAARLPRAVAVVDPKRPDCPYPNKALAGVGVGFKLVCAVEGPDRLEALMERYSDLVAMGTVADVMSMRGENRALVTRGLRELNRNRRPGIRSLMEQAGLGEREITSGTIGFNLAPRLNAAGRMSRTSLTVELLMTRDGEEADRLAAELNSLNAERRTIETGIMDEAVAMLGEGPVSGPIVLAREDWFQGVLGIVATRLAEKYYVPVILISTGSGEGRGSCRSFGGFPIFDALQACADLLTGFGGHEMAAGLTIPAGNVDELRRRLGEYYHARVDHRPVPTLKLDFEVLKPQLLSFENVTALKCMEPYGSGNLAPMLCMRGVRLASISGVGGGSHTKVRLGMAGESFDGIFFCRAPEELGLTAGDLVDAAFEVQINEFRGRRSVQLLLSDLRRHME